MVPARTRHPRQPRPPHVLRARSSAYDAGIKDLQVRGAGPPQPVPPAGHADDVGNKHRTLRTKSKVNKWQGAVN